MEIATALLENWMRDYYFSTEIDIGSSGVEDFSFSELRKHLDITVEELDQVILCDSPSHGAPALRDALAKRWTNGNSERVMATNGSSEAIFLIMNALLQPGDEVVVLNPCYHSLVQIARSIQCRLKYWHMRFEDQFQPNLDELRSVLGPQTRMVVVNFPHNPTGVSLTAEQQADLLEMVARSGAYLVWDAAFAEIVYDRAALPDPSNLYERAISMGTLSKAYGAPGLRVGWCLAPPDVLTRCIHLRDYTTLYLSPLLEFVAQRVIENADIILSMRLQQAYTNLGLLTEWVEQHQEFLDWVRPQGGVTAFIHCRTLNNIDDFCHHLAQMHRVLLVPGSCFDNPRHMRLGFGGCTDDLKRGLAYLSKELKARSIIPKNV